jgi:adenosylcobinamide-GDP ribazoletransferase
VVALVLVPLLLTALFCRHCLRRFGGVTGDVLGACVEVCFTTALLVAAI